MDIVEILLSDGRTINGEFLKLTVIKATQKISSSGNIGILNLILQKCPINKSLRDAAVNEASGPNRDIIIEMLNRATVTNDRI